MAELNNDPIKKLGEQATEIVDLLAELGQAVSQPAAEDLAVEKVIEVPKVLEEKTEEMIEEPATEEPTEEPTPEPIEEPTEEPAEEVVEPTAEPTSKPVCKCHKWVCWLIGALLLLGIVGTGFYFRAPLMQWWFLPALALSHWASPLLWILIWVKIRFPALWNPFAIIMKP